MKFKQVPEMMPWSSHVVGLAETFSETGPIYSETAILSANMLSVQVSLEAESRREN